MIDTINIHLPEHFIPNNYTTDFKHLFTDHETSSSALQLKHTGRFKNFRVSIDRNGVFICGSLTRYYLGTNQKTLLPSDIPKAIQRLSDELKLPIHKSKVHRLDLAENIITTQPVSLYYNLLGNKTGVKRLELECNLMYKNTRRKILLYDKVLEVQKKKRELEKIYTNKNVMRIEYSFLKHQVLSELLGLQMVTLEDIVLHYPDLVDTWYDGFSDIEKYRDRVTLDIKVFEENGMFDKQIRMIGVEAIGGMKAITKMVRAANQAKMFGHSNKSANILNRYKQLMATHTLTTSSPLIDELERKVKIAHFVNSSREYAI